MVRSFTWGDTKGDPIFAQEEVKRLIEDERVTSIIGCYQSSVTQSVSFQAEIYNIPFLSPDADAYCPLAYLDQIGFFALEEPLKIAGVYADHVISTAAWALGLTRKLPLAREINQLYKSRYGDNLNSVNALSFTGIYVLVDAIACAHSESPRDIRRSLVNTDIPGDTLILPWDGIHFDETGQNIFADSMVLQVLNKTNKIVWPKDLVETNVIIPAYPCN